MRPAENIQNLGTSQVPIASRNNKPFQKQFSISLKTKKLSQAHANTPHFNKLSMFC